MLNFRIKIVQLFTIGLIASCNTTKNEKTNAQVNEAILHQIVVYKTSKNYSNYVPIQLNNEGTKIISYPSPTDLMVDGKLSKPIKLKKGYWLDKRGITQNTVFINYTYNAYNKLAEAPSIQALYASIIDKHPIIEMYNCSAIISKTENLVSALNLMIEQNKLTNCTCIKK